MTRALGYAVALLGLGVWGGWFFNAPLLNRLNDLFPAMRVATAYMFLCLGVSLVALTVQRPWGGLVAMAGAWGILWNAMAQFVAPSLGCPEPWARWALPRSIDAFDLAAGTSSACTLACFTLAAMALQLQGSGAARPWACLCWTIVGADALFVLLGYFVGHDAWTCAASGHVAMAPHTALGFLMAAVAGWTVRPAGGTVHG